MQFKAPKQTPPNVYTFPEGFAGGMNISVTPDRILPNQSPDMLNMNYNNGGVPGSRNAFVKVATLTAKPIRCMFYYGNKMIVVSDGKIWEVDTL